MRDPHFFQNCGTFQYNISWLCFDVSWCCIEKYHNFERNEDRATVFLKWTDFSTKRQIISGRWAKYVWPSQNIRTLRGGSFVFLMHQSFHCLYLIAHRMISHLRLECLHSFLQSSTEIMIKYNHEAVDKCSILCLMKSVNQR